MPRIAGLLLACALALAKHLRMHKQAPHLHQPRIGNSRRRWPGGGSAQARQPMNLPRVRAVGGGECPSRRVLCPRNLAREPFRCESYQPQGSGRNCSIHAADRQLARPRRSVRAYSSRFGTRPLTLRELLDQFGNLGLAAAAYNAGPAELLVATHLSFPSVCHVAVDGDALGLAPGPLGVLTACWVRAQPPLSCCQARKLRTVFPCVPLSRYRLNSANSLPS